MGEQLFLPERPVWDYPAWGIVWARKDNLPHHWSGAERNVYGEGKPWAYGREECQKECDKLNVEFPSLIHSVVFYTQLQSIEANKINSDFIEEENRKSKQENQGGQESWQK